MNCFPEAVKALDRTATRGRASMMHGLQLIRAQAKLESNDGYRTWKLLTNKRCQIL